MHAGHGRGDGVACRRPTSGMTPSSGQRRPAKGVGSVLGDLASSLPYGFLTRMVPGVARAQRAARTALFRRAVDEVRDACDLMRLPGPPPDALDVALRRIVWEQLQTPLLKALTRASQGQLTRWVVVEGDQVLAPARAGGRGFVVVNSHFGIGRAVPPVLAGLGYRLYSLEGTNVLASIGARQPADLEVAEVSRNQPFRLREAYLAHSALQRGSLVHLMGDVRRGGRTLPLPFLGRLRPFATAFAELAIMTGAAVVPVFATLDRRGRTRVELLDALHGGTAEAPHRERVVSLVGQYVRLLEQRWISQPGELLRGQLFAQRSCSAILAGSGRSSVFEAARQPE
jgi:lauroyl/myristoyl acyltransferase